MAEGDPEPRKSRVRSNPRVVKGQALLTGPGEKNVTRGGLVFDEVVDKRDIRAIYERSTIGHRDLGKFVGDVFSEWFALEGEDDALIEAIEELNVRLRLQARLWDTVKHAMLDGVALLYKNFSDTALEPGDPVMGAREILSLHPIYEPDIKDLISDTNRASPRFGLLDVAKVDITDPDSKRRVWDGPVHWSRVFHVAWDPLYGSLAGMSYFKPSHDSYKAQKNIEWGTGETFHRNAAGTKLVEVPDTMDAAEVDKLEENIKDLDASKELMVPAGVKISTIKPQPIPPKDYLGYFLKTVSTMPETLLVGAHEGAVTGSETNLRIYHMDVRQVQENFVTPLLQDFYAQLQEISLLPAGVLPAIIWRPIWTMTDEQAAMVWERKARSARMLAGNEARGDPQLMTGREIRRLVLGVDAEPAEEDLPPALPGTFRVQQLEIDPEIRAHFIGRMARATDPVLESWTRDMLAVNGRMRQAVLTRARDLLAGRLDRLLRRRRRNAVRPQDIRRLAAEVTEAITVGHIQELNAAIRKGFRDALLAGTGSVEIKGTVSEQELPEDLVNWWEANSTQWSTTMSRDTIQSVKNTVREGLEAGDSMGELELRLGREFDLKAHEAERIARTETIRAASEARIREYKRLGVRRLVFMSTPDDRTGPECWSFDGQVFSVEASTGVIPVHPNCRCTWVAEMELT